MVWFRLMHDKPFETAVRFVVGLIRLDCHFQSKTVSSVSAIMTTLCVPSVCCEKSDAWNLFKKADVDGQVKALCSLCQKHLKYNGRTTSNLREHMAWHKKKSAQLNPEPKSGPVQRQVTLDMLRVPQLIRPCPFPKATKITELLAK